jgi:hypothetical protein
MRTLADHRGWGVGIMAWPSAYILAFADKLMITGKIFENCRDLVSIVQRGQAELAQPAR